jgi:hypothetical protein
MTADRTSAFRKRDAFEKVADEQVSLRAVRCSAKTAPHPTSLFALKIEPIAGNRLRLATRLRSTSGLALDRARVGRLRLLSLAPGPAANQRRPDLIS